MTYDLSHTKKHVFNPVDPDSDDGMKELREQAERGESIVIPCPVCDEEVSGPLTIDSGDIRWDCPDCGPCNLSWYC